MSDFHRFDNYSITLMFCLHEVENRLKDNTNLLLELEMSGYYYPDFLSDFFYYFLYHYCYVCYDNYRKENIDRYKWFISNHTSESGYLLELERYLYRLYINKIPIILTGTCETTFDYYPDKNSLFFLHIP